MPTWAFPHLQWIQPNLKALLLKNNQNSYLRLCLCSCHDLWNSLFQKAAKNCEPTLLGFVVDVEFVQEHNGRQGRWTTRNIFKRRFEVKTDLIRMEKHNERQGSCSERRDMIHKLCTLASRKNQASNRLFIMKIPWQSPLEVVTLTRKELAETMW